MALIGKRYLLYQALGQGGMGTVYQAADRLTGAIVALKQVTALSDQLQDTPGSDSSDFRLSLSNEFRTLASLHHRAPSIGLPVPTRRSAS